jgi:hypothetical protein
MTNQENGALPQVEISPKDVEALLSSAGFPQCLGLLTDLAREQVKNIALMRALSASESLVTELKGIEEEAPQ